MFRRKHRLEKGSARRNLNPDAKWLIKKTEGYAREVNKAASRLDQNRRMKANWHVRWGFGLMILTFASLPALYLSYVYLMPASVISVVTSPDDAAWIVGLRKAGCSTRYLEYRLNRMFGKGGMDGLKNLRACTEQRMEFPV